MQSQLSSQEKWDSYWGDEYQQGRKLMTFSPLFHDMASKDQLGTNIVDVGSGMHPMSSFIPPELKTKVISIDRSGGEHTYGSNGLKLRVNLEALDNVELVREKVAKAAAFLELDREAGKRQIDSFIFSDILNYVDYRKVLEFFKKYLKPGGRFLLNEWPGRGYTNLHSDNGLDSIRNLYDFLESEGFEIERGPGVDIPFEGVIVARLKA